MDKQFTGNYKERAECAEAQIANVQALADSLYAQQDSPTECAIVARQIFAALGSPPIEGQDTTPDDEAQVDVQWAVDLGFTVARARDEEHARQWVKGYEDNPDALTEGDPMPVAVRRSVTTTRWTRVNPSNRSDG